jgi:hypothetical protein
MPPGADKAFDTRGFVQGCRKIDVTPRVARTTTRVGGSAIDGRTTRHAGYQVSQRKQKCIEQCFGWAKVIGRIRQVMLSGAEGGSRVHLDDGAYNPTRLRTLTGAET